MPHAIPQTHSSFYPHRRVIGNRCNKLGRNKLINRVCSVDVYFGIYSIVHIVFKVYIVYSIYIYIYIYIYIVYKVVYIYI